jgi:hypothetical protein
LNETNFTDISHITDESNNVNVPLVKKTIYSKQKYVPKKGSSNKKTSPNGGVTDSPPSRNPGNGVAFSSTVTLG